MIAQVLEHTPAWVWLLLFALLYLGFAQMRTRRVSRARLYALPIAMLAWSLASLFATFGDSAPAAGAWLAGVLGAYALNGYLRTPKAVSYSAQERRYTIPGSPLPLALMLSIFVLRYAVSAAISLDPALRAASAFAFVAGLGYGFFSGLFFARALHAARAADQQPDAAGLAAASASTSGILP